THGYELWQSDGTASGTVLVGDINPGSASSSPSDLTNVNGTLFFAADDGSHGAELWVLPSTPAGVASLAVSGFPTATTAGASGSSAVTAKDTAGTVVTGYTGTVHFSSSAPQAVLPADATLGNGTGLFSATLKTAGYQSITATDSRAATITGAEAGIRVVPL